MEEEDCHLETQMDKGLEEEEEGPRGIARVKAVSKLGLIITCYAASFISLVQLGFLLVKDHEFGPIILYTDVFTWLGEKWTYSVWWDMVTLAMIRNFGLLILFCAQHTLMSQRKLESTSYWMRLHYVYKIDRPIYVLGTALALQGIIRWWQPVPVVLWTMHWTKDWYHFVHLLAWISLYGTSLMLDLPDMVGFNQVVVSSPTVTQKSPDLQIMYRSQRHMGLLPFMFILLAHPNMTLDRFLLTICTILYTYGCWRSSGCYDYASRMKQMKKRRL